MKILILAFALNLKTNQQCLLKSRLVKGNVYFKICPIGFRWPSIELGLLSPEDLGTNYLKVVTDFSQQDLGQLKTRIAAALEMN
jgi:hypothetical protein